MGRLKTTEERTAKRLKRIAERKLLQQEQSERDETKIRPEKIIRRPAIDHTVVNASVDGVHNFGQDSLRQKKG